MLSDGARPGRRRAQTATTLVTRQGQSQTVAARIQAVLDQPSALRVGGANQLVVEVDAGSRRVRHDLEGRGRLLLRSSRERLRCLERGRSRTCPGPAGGPAGGGRRRARPGRSCGLRPGQQGRSRCGSRSGGRRRRRGGGRGRGWSRSGSGRGRRRRRGPERGQTLGEGLTLFNRRLPGSSRPLQCLPGRLEIPQQQVSLGQPQVGEVARLEVGAVRADVPAGFGPFLDRLLEPTRGFPSRATLESSQALLVGLVPLALGRLSQASEHEPCADHHETTLTQM